MPQSITSPMKPNWYRFVLSRHAYSFVYHGIQLTVIRLMSAIWHLPVSPLLLWSFRAVDRTCFMCSLVTTFLPCVFFRDTSRKSSVLFASCIWWLGWVGWDPVRIFPRRFAWENWDDKDARKWKQKTHLANLTWFTSATDGRTSVRPSGQTDRLQELAYRPILSA